MTMRVSVDVRPRPLRLSVPPAAVRVRAGPERARRAR